MKPKQEDPKEMVGGCCVCSDENGWTENPLVYCDGQGCNVAVHQACYGIVTVPTGAWFCRKCESQERAARVRCELCPSKDGALKRTDSGGWAHVVCALYIPEVRFGNVTTMEPIMLQLIPQERFNKSCYICEESGKESRAVIGACMQCNKSGCKQHFHVTCAQSMGLLCEEAGNYLDNVKYCGYCQYHFSKLRKGSHVKTIPPYRPVPLEAGTSDDDKTSGAVDSRDPKSKKRTGRPPGVKPTASRDGKIGDIITPGSSGSGPSGTGEHHDRGPLGEDSTGVTPGSSGMSIGATSSSSLPPAIKTERTKVTEPSAGVSASQSVATVTKTMASVTVSAFTSSSTSSAPPPQTTSSLTPSFVTSLPAVSAPFTPTNVSSTATLLTTTPSLSTAVSCLTSSVSSSIASSLSSSSLSSLITSVPSSVVTTAAALARPRLSEAQNPSTAPHESSSQLSLSHNHSTSQVHPSLSTEGEKDKDKHQERNRKLRRNGPRTPSGNSSFGDTESIVSNDEAQSNDLVLNICEEKNLSVEKESNKVPSKPLDSSDDGGSLNVQFTPNIGSKSVSDPFTPTLADFSANEPVKRRSQERGRRSKRGMSKRGRPGGGRDTGGRDSGASSPDSFTSESAPAPKRGRKKVDSKESLTSVITNGVGANTLLLGNQLNPSSAVAQKMTDTLHAELEAHSIYKDEEKISNMLVGPSLPGKKENTNGSSLATSNQPPPFPQSLEQLLERQWEQGSQFLMEQAQHFDIASLLSCLHQLRQENVRLEETVSSLISRRDHLLAVNARLSVPLSSPTPASTSSPVGANPTPPSVSATSSNTSLSTTSSSVPALTTSVPSHNLNPRPSSRGSAPAPLPPRPHSQGHHQSGAGSHTGPPSGGGGGHRGTSPHDRRGPSPQDRRGTSPHDRRAPPPQIPIENGLGEQEYRYRSPGTEHRQQSPMLPPGAQPSPTTSLRHSPAGGSYHSSVSPHGVGSPSPSGVPHGHPPTSHGPPTHHSMPPSHGPSGHSQGPLSHGSPHGPPPHGAPPHGPPPPMVSVAPNSAHNVAISRQSDHRGEMVRMHTGAPAPPQHSGPNLGPGGYSVYQMVSSVPGPHHSPVPTMSQPHPPPHAQNHHVAQAKPALNDQNLEYSLMPAQAGSIHVMRRDLVESGRGATGNMDKR